ncbi:MAG: hypothetical protein GYA55_14600 [SAR324 cluster bacterium]|uniref:Uncharacterized protein n=1 Tax=SAR324 cluster bacterium TaxID=2024889 RepID=A0A7X9FUZ8_9DELT|nr:hypothetical protein [SAR324 cluster bacterium]
MSESLYLPLITVAEDLEEAGLIWQPEIGDEVSDRFTKATVSILIDPQGMTPSELRATFIWLPTVEQLIEQVEARQGILKHMGIELSGDSIFYKTILRAKAHEIEAKAESLRISLGIALKNLLTDKSQVFLQ